MEVAVKKFKASIIYQNNLEESIDIEAKNTPEALKKCEDIKKEHIEMLARFELHNIYTTRKIKDCVLCKVDWREQLESCLLDFDKPKQEN
jgi:hypothetical protein